MRLLRAADHRRMPWKNGGGVTMEIAVSPPDARLDNFDWRVSMARVEADGPFSSFPGVDRVLTVLEGDGIILNVEGRTPLGLLPTSEPVAFPADVATSCNLVAGPISDLNVMVRRGRFRTGVNRLGLDGGSEFASRADVVLMFCQDGEAAVSDGTWSVTLARHDGLRIDAHTDALKIEPKPRAALVVVELTAV